MEEKMIDDGGGAFPSQEIDFHASAEAGRNVVCGEHAGMSLRDYFAAQAMRHAIWGWHGNLENSQACLERSAAEAYRIADAMIEARKNGGERE